MRTLGSSEENSLPFNSLTAMEFQARTGGGGDSTAGNTSMCIRASSEGRVPNILEAV